MLIREAKLSDAAKIARVNVETWKSTYQELLPPQQLVSWLHFQIARIMRGNH